MSELIVPPRRLAPASDAAIEKVRQFGELLKRMPQQSFTIEHLLHAGMYTRTTRLPAGTALAAVLIQVPTVLIIMGEGRVYNDDKVVEVAGYTVLAGSAGRKVAMVTLSEFAMSMIFPTQAKTIAEAEREFTPEHELLIAPGGHTIVITGE
jgi:hypothetical protein